MFAGENVPIRSRDLCKKSQMGVAVSVNFAITFSLAIHHEYFPTEHKTFKNDFFPISSVYMSFFCIYPDSFTETKRSSFTSAQFNVWHALSAHNMFV